jgi:hypothetical protein
LPKHTDSAAGQTPPPKFFRRLGPRGPRPIHNKNHNPYSVRSGNASERSERAPPAKTPFFQHRDLIIQVASGLALERALGYRSPRPPFLHTPKTYRILHQPKTFSKTRPKLFQPKSTAFFSATSHVPKNRCCPNIQVLAGGQPTPTAFQSKKPIPIV